jgi:type IV secretion system protein VirB3
LQIVPDEDILFLACTRPAMIFGITIEAAFFLVIVTGILFLIGGHLFYLLFGFLFYGMCYCLCKKDPNQFSILLAFIKTKLSCKTRFYWNGASTVSPLKLKKRNHDF